MDASEVRGQTVLTMSDLQEAATLQLPLGLRLGVAAAAAGAFLALVADFGDRFVTGTFFVGALALTQMHRLIAKKALAGRTPEDLAMTYTVGEQGITLANKATSSPIAWSQVVQHGETKSAFYVVTNYGLLYLIPKRAFQPGDLVHVRRQFELHPSVPGVFPAVPVQRKRSMLRPLAIWTLYILLSFALWSLVHVRR